MSNKSIPNGDFDFVMKAESYVRNIAPDPARFDLMQKDVESLATAVARFREKLNAARSGSGSKAATAAKDEARERLKPIYQRIRNLVRTSNRVDAAAKVLLDIPHERAKPKVHTCPQEPPRLKFVRPHHEPGAMPVHELEFRAMDYLAGAKPEGAEKLELFVDLIPPEEPIPAHPGANHNGRPWYLRSYNRSPIKLIPPMTNVPMRVVYWGRWVDKQGNFGPFSATAVGWMEGGSHLPRLNPTKDLPKLMEDASASGPADRAVTYRVALIEAQVASFNPQQMSSDPALPAPREEDQRRLEGPAKSEAA